MTGGARDHGQTGRHHLKAQGPTPPRRGSAPDPTPLHWRTVAARLLIVAVLLLGLLIGTGLSITRLAPGNDVEKADTATVQWLAGERTKTLDAVSGPAAELGNTWVVIGVRAGRLLLRRHRGAAPTGGFGPRARQWALIGELAIFLTTTAVIDRPAARP